MFPMVRISKQAQVRNVSRRRPRPPAVKTGPKKDKLPAGFKTHVNAIADVSMAKAFISKIQ